jgi:hypothetical protein
MSSSSLRRSALAVLLTLGCLTAVRAQVSVTTYHNDLARTGQNTQETILTPANVNSTQFGKLYSVPVDGAVYAQPLYLWAVNIAGGTHNVLYVVTEHDSVYAIDADTGTVYLQVSLIPSGGSTVSSSGDLGCSDLIPEIGISGTPVIDPATGTLYVVAKSKVNGSLVQYLHALAVTTLAEKFGGPVQIQASVPGNAVDASGGVLTFNPKQENQRAALALTNGHVIISWGSHCDHGPWHGWVMAYNASTLAQEAVFSTSPNGSDGGVWLAGGAPAVDTNGNIYFPTGNGDWNGTTDYGDSILKLGPPTSGQFPVLDYFTPFDQGTLDSQDIDVASGGLVLLPPLASGKQLLAQQGKAGTIVLLDTSNLGQYCGNLTPPCTNTDPQIVQEIQNASAGIWGSPAYWNGNLYWTGANDTINAYSFNANNSGLISTTPTSQSARSFAFSAPTPIVSSNGTSNGILWALDGSADDSTCDGGGANCLGLFAYDATNLANLLYTSSQAPNNRDSPGVAVKFEKPMVANGKAFIGTQSSVTAYGLLPPPAATPTFQPAPGTYSAAQSVTLSSTTSGASFYYTTNGTTPTVNSTLYSGAIAVSASMTIEAIAVASGYSASPVASGVYVINIPGGSTEVSLTGSANVDGFVATGSAVPSGGLDNDGYAYSATLVGTSLTWNGNTYAFGSAGVADAVSNTTIALPAGSYTTLSLLGTAVNGNRANQTFTVNYSDGSSTNFTQSMSDWFTPQNYSGETKVLPMAYRVEPNGALDNRTFYLYGYSFALNGAKTVTSLTLPKTRNVIVLAVDVSGATNSPPPAAAPTFQPAPGTYSTPQSLTLSSTTPGFSIYYTTNGTTPTVNSTLYSGAIAVSSSMTIEAIAVASGYSASPVASGAYVIAPPAAAPTFQPAPGSYSTAQSVTLSSTTPGFSIYYTTNGTTPTVNSTLYSGAIAVNASMTIEAIAVASGYSTSPVASGAYVISPPAAAPTFQPAPGSYSTAQSVTLSSTTPGFSIYYTTNGTTPTVNSTLYSGAIAVSSSMTVEAIAVASGYSASPVASGAYVIGTPAAAPTFSPPGGTYTATQLVTLSDTIAGASMYYTTNGTTPSVSATPYTGPITVSSSMTIEAVALASGYLTSPVASAAYVINTGTTTEVPLTGSVNVDGFVANGSAVPSGGLDNDGYAYSATLVGTSLTWNGNTYAFGSGGVADAVSNTTIALPAGSYTTLSLLGTAVNGNRANQTFTVNYSDGSSTNFTQSMSDWFTPQNYAGETKVLPMAYRVEPNGALDNRTFYLYGYSFALNSAKTATSLTLPKTRNVIVLAVDVH